MIRLICTNCKATLEMDDAFAGGVCRCQYCGTIQTVPSHLKKSGNLPQPAGAKTLYQSHPSSPGPGTGTGLDELADIVASSGLGTGLQDRRGSKSGSVRPPTASRAGAAGGALPMAQGAPPPRHAVGYATPSRERRPPNRTVFILAGAGGAAVLCIVLALLLFRSGTRPNTATIGGGGGGGSQVAAVQGPRFVNLPLNASRVVYVIDCGSSSQNVFDPLKHALYQSLKTLGPDREFQVIFWQRIGEERPVTYPEAGTARATPDQIEACRNHFADVTAHGRTRVDEAIQLAMARQPEVVVLATAKDFDLDENFVQTVEQARAGADVKVHTVDLSGSGTSGLLKEIARKTGGRHVTVTRQVLEGL